MFSLVAFIPRAILQGMPLLFGCTGETISEKVGSLNLGIPGVMYVGAICGVIGSFLYEQSCGGQVVPIIAILIPFVCCLAGALIMAIINTGLSLLGAQTPVQLLVKGFVIIAAILMDNALKSRQTVVAE